MKDPTSSQILQPTNACQSHPTFINAVKISMQNEVFYNKIYNVILLNHTNDSSETNPKWLGSGISLESHSNNRI